MINPIETWEQPSQITTSNDANYLFMPTQPTMDILELNDYCLEIIFDYLDIKSQLGLSLAHERFENVFVNMICSRSSSSYLNIDQLGWKEFCDWELLQFFKTAGQYIRHIEYYADLSYHISYQLLSYNIYDIIKEFCTNIQRVTLVHRSRDDMKLLDSININLLTEIELYQCDIKDQDLEKFVDCSNLISLCLAYNTYYLVGDALPRFKNLQRLSVYNCNAMKADNLMEACKNMNLKYLDMRCKYGSTEILKYCPELETLKVTLKSGQTFQEIMCLENLISLEIDNESRTTPFPIETLYEQFYDNLEILKIYSSLLTNVMCNFRSLRTLWLLLIDDSTGSIIETIATLKELEELYILKSFRLKASDISPIVENCEKLKCLAFHQCSKRIQDWITSCYNVLEKRDFKTPTTSDADSSKKTLTIYFDVSVMSRAEVDEFFDDINHSLNKKLLKLKKFKTSPITGLLNNDLPFSVRADDESDDDDYSTSVSSSADDDGRYYNGYMSSPSFPRYYGNHDSDDDDDDCDDSDDSDDNDDNPEKYKFSVSAGDENADDYYSSSDDNFGNDNDATSSQSFKKLYANHDSDDDDSDDKPEKYKFSVSTNDEIDDDYYSTSDDNFGNDNDATSSQSCQKYDSDDKDMPGKRIKLNSSMDSLNQ